MLSLSGIVYTDGSGVSIDVADPAWKAPLGFDPWYTTSILPPASIGVGDTIDFATTYTHVTSVPSPSSPTAIYSIAIGTNTPSAFTGFTSLSTITCAKYYMSSGISECDWG